MYILCSVYSTNPDITGPTFLQDISEVEANVSLSDAKPEESQPKPDISDAKDHFEELKSLGLYKDDSKDVELNKRNAVIRFQSMCNMTITGEWDEKSQAALTKIVTDKKEISFNDSIAAPPSEEKWFVLNKTKKILTLYYKDKVVKKYPVAIGKASAMTPGGNFSIVSKIVNPGWGGGGYAKPVKGGSPYNPLGYRWMGLSYKDGSSIGIHGNNSPYSIGKEISSGCIRMINSDMEELFINTPIKSIIWIGTENELKDLGVIQPELLQNAEENF
ncbi:MAG: L,D-transpeptidase [Ruminiclostridium sp.]|nr:L,D-transpeptidase [Ruminiclostridium sp.]